MDGRPVEIELRFSGLVWTVDLTVETKLRFCDRLVWTVDLTVEIKLRFCDVLMWMVRLKTSIFACFTGLRLLCRVN